MAFGVYNCSGASAWELETTARVKREAMGSDLVVRGPLALAADPASSLRVAESDEITCVMDGYLYEPGVVGRELGLDVADGPALVARAYRHFGLEIFSRLRGRFSLALWDGARRQGILTSDLLATKPLFTWRGVGHLVFATELHELLSIVPSRPGPDCTVFTTWLAGGMCPDGRTLYQGVSRLGPGELIELRPHSTRLRTHWRPSYAPVMTGTRSELASTLRDRIDRSTGRRLSPSATGVVLSGGLDSSIVTASAARTKPADAQLRTYSAVFPGAEFDESSKIRDLASAVGVEPAAFQVAPRGTLWLALQHTKRWQTPLMGAGALIEATVVDAAAHDGAGVVMDGQTGDEVLGFAPYVVADWMRQGRLLAAIQLTGRWPMGRPPTRRERLWILHNCGLKGIAPYRLGRFVRERRDRGPVGPPWLLSHLQKRSSEIEDIWAWKTRSSGPRWWQHLADLLVQSPHRELRVDYLRHRASAAGIVNESPLYDVDLIDTCLRLPPELAFDSTFTRPLAREAFRGILPDSVRLQRQKAIFSSFCMDALIGADAPGIERLLAAPDAELGAYADMEQVRRLWHDERPGPGRNSMRWGTLVWRLAAAETWLRLQADPAFIDEMLAHKDLAAPSRRRVQLSPVSTFFPLAGARSSV